LIKYNKCTETQQKLTSTACDFLSCGCKAKPRKAYITTLNVKEQQLL